ncbi:hypothetical protein P0O15_04355 [Methanotrichaceae archaeon Mx]|uniref:Uncharacterized protein n=1 Tax=Candidatus Methanocrinis natronophilus TaxID=3033396 RepID=A0ABT5X6T5_9EURY|nr:hypothetical protein [Candidatus Methanocrinis natronophilus]
MVEIRLILFRRPSFGEELSEVCGRNWRRDASDLSCKGGWIIPRPEEGMGPCLKELVTKEFKKSQNPSQD